MTKLSRLAFAAIATLGLAGPAFAQGVVNPSAPATATSPSSTTPPTQVQTPLPDSGMKKTAVTSRVHHHAHRHVHHVRVAPEAAPAPTAKN